MRHILLEIVAKRGPGPLHRHRDSHGLHREPFPEMARVLDQLHQSIAPNPNPRTNASATACHSRALAHCAIHRNVSLPSLMKSTIFSWLIGKTYSRDRAKPLPPA